MPKRKGIPKAAVAVVIILAICAAGWFVYRAFQGDAVGRQKAASSSGSSKNAGSVDASGNLIIGEDEQTMPEWVPYAVDNSPVLPLEGYLYEGKTVDTASSREAQASGDSGDKITGQVKGKVPHYPFDQIPLLKPDMLVMSDEQTLDEDISFNVMYYTKATVDEALAYFRDKFSSCERYQEDEFDATTGKTYSLSFSIQVEGYKTDAGVMVMAMPETTGYSCAISASGAIRGIAKKEVKPIGTRDDGLPENFPDNIVQAYKLQDIYDAQGDSSGCWVQFTSSASYKEALDYYRNLLNDKTDFSESDEGDGGIYFYCLVPGWEIDVRVMEMDGIAYIEINCYVE